MFTKLHSVQFSHATLHDGPGPGPCYSAHIITDLLSKPDLASTFEGLVLRLLPLWRNYIAGLNYMTPCTSVIYCVIIGLVYKNHSEQTTIRVTSNDYRFDCTPHVHILCSLVFRPSLPLVLLHTASNQNLRQRRP